MKIERRLKAMRSDRNKVAFILLSLLESAFVDPIRDSDINVTIVASAMPTKIPNPAELLPFDKSLASIDFEELRAESIANCGL